ncbi:UNVERIFIED_CONTAM: hypothetical protein PYX00_011634 [Menopon gallinae]|uniref:N-acetyltransferase domain-containing protein n=1 Tax=Menopon gallinae TaxID=328185 RepID=A0AAW2H8B4_9NEOP
MFCAILLAACARTSLQEYGYDLYEFHPEEQHLKLFSQIAEMCSLLDKNLYTGREDRESKLGMVQGCSTFNLWDGGWLVASVCIAKSKYFGLRNGGDGMAAGAADIVCYDALEIYSFAVDEKYRGRGIAGVFLGAAIERMRKRFSLGESTYLGLHLNPKDRMMWFAFAIYLRYGFMWGRVCRYGPSDMVFYGDAIPQLEHPLMTAMNVISGRRRGSFVALYTRIRHFRRRKPDIDMQDLIMVGRLLQKSLHRNTGRAKDDAAGGSGKHNSKATDDQWANKDESICEGILLSEVNPIMDSKCASSYKVEIADRDKVHKNVSPACTEVVEEAKNQGLVPTTIFTIFASPRSTEMSDKMPANLNALVSGLIYNSATDDSNTPENGGGYVFLKGAVADAFEGGAGKKKDDSKDKGKEEDSGESEGADDNDKGGNSSGQKS